MIDPVELHKVLAYDPCTGTLCRKKTGKAVTKECRKGYIRVKVYSKEYQAHRLIWAMQTGSWPPSGMEVDHKNRVRNDNSWDNLTLKTSNENSHNMSMHRDNTSGYLGVSWNKKRKKWTAQIYVNGKQLNLGGYVTPEEASQAYQKAKRIHHPTAFQ